ncbi:MAG: 30S ribosomal protein S20 [Deltaproteobacteria bacterium]|nr:30S ribosomal protein S20 [Deltaproteobacteria bacterium]
MANHKSAEKRARQDVKKRDRNKSYLSGVRTSLKGFRIALDKGDMDAATSSFNRAQASLGKAVAKGIVHKNAASRKIGRMARSLKAIAQS